MRYLKFSNFDTANGRGIGVVLWVSGCEHHCPGCHNPSTWNPSEGVPFDEKAMRDLTKMLINPHIKRLTLSGGDPLAPYNRDTIEVIVRTVKDLFPEKIIWCYTGYNWEEVKDLNLMKSVDVLVDGEFIQELKDISLPYSGSTNQRIIDVKNTLEQDNLVLYWNGLAE